MLIMIIRYVDGAGVIGRVRKTASVRSVGKVPPARRGAYARKAHMGIRLQFCQQSFQTDIDFRQDSPLWQYFLNKQNIISF